MSSPRDVNQERCSQGNLALAEYLWKQAPTSLPGQPIPSTSPLHPEQQTVPPNPGTCGLAGVGSGVYGRHVA